MTERYSTFILRIRALADLDPLYFDGSAEIWDVNGRQELNAAGRGSFKLYASNAALLSAVESNIGQVATVYVTDQVAAGANMDLATFIIKNIDTDTGEGVSEITVSGPEVTDQLRNTDAGDNAIDNGAGGPSTTDISDIMAYASAGWSLTGATATAAGTYHASRGDTVLKLLNAAAQQSGEIFRLATYADPTSKGLFWTATPDASGVFLFMPTSHNQYDGSTTVGKLYSLRREYDFEPVITSIRPYGAGVGGGRLDITSIDSGDTGADPSWLDTTFASNFMENSDLLTALGYPIKQDIDFSWIQANDPTNATQLVSAAVAIWKTGKNFLEQNDAAREFYTAVCNVAANLRPGQSVTLVYPEFQGGITGGSQTIDIDKTLTILSVENRFEEGERITTLTLGDKPLPQPTAASWVADVAEKTQDTTRKSDPSTSPGAVSTSRTLNAVLPLRIDGGDSGDLSANRTFTLDGLNSYGAANQVAGVNAAATGWEYKTLTEGTGITIGHSAGAITITNSSPGSGSHVLATTSALGPDHTVSGLTARQVLIATGATTALFRALQDADIPSTLVRTSTTITAGNGLTGGGDLSTNRTITMGTPGSTTSTSTNAVTASSHTHEADSSIARAQISINAGDGLTGGGNLTANRTITMGTPSTLTVSTTNAVTATSHTHAITSSSAVSTATAVLLATDSNGRVQVRGLGVGAAAGTTNAIMLPDDGWIGLGSSAARIVFDDQITDQIEILNADVILGAQTKDGNIASSINSKFSAIDGDIVISQSADDALFAAYSYGTTVQAAVHLRTGRGTRGTPTASQSGDSIGRLGGSGYSGSAFPDGSNAFVQFVASENWSGTNNGARAEIHSTANAATAPTKIASFTATSSEPKLTISGNGDEMIRLDNGSTTGNPYISFHQSGTRRSFIQHNDTSDTLVIASEYGIIELKTGTAGNELTRVTVHTDGGVTVGGATGGSKGAGTINVSGDIYKNNSLFVNPDYALEAWRDGRIVQHAHKPGARDYRRLTLGEVEDHIRSNLRLPGFGDQPLGMFGRGDLLLEKIEELFTHLIEINHKVEVLHGANN